jgi:hypothetical protein
MQTAGAVLVVNQQCSPVRMSVPVQGGRGAHRLLYLAAVRNPLGWRCPRGPGEAACFGDLAGDLSGDQAADRVGVCARQFWISPALDFGPQGVAGPAGRACAWMTPGTDPAAASAVVITSGSTPSASRCTTSLVTS